MIKIFDKSEITVDRIIPRYSNSTNVSDIVSDIIADVRENGDDALKKYSKKFDNAELADLEVSDAEFDEAMNVVDAEFVEIIKQAKELAATKAMIWPLFYTGVFYLLFVGLLTVVLGKLEKKLSYFRS